MSAPLPRSRLGCHELAAPRHCKALGEQARAGPGRRDGLGEGPCKGLWSGRLRLHATLACPMRSLSLVPLSDDRCLAHIGAPWQCWSLRARMWCPTSAGALKQHCQTPSLPAAAHKFCDLTFAPALAQDGALQSTAPSWHLDVIEHTVGQSAAPAHSRLASSGSAASYCRSFPMLMLQRLVDAQPASLFRTKAESSFVRRMSALMGQIGATRHAPMRRGGAPRNRP